MNRQQEERPAFDEYASGYADLIDHPIRNRFAPGNRFFFERKIEVIRRFLQRDGIQTGELDWLDIGCGQGDLLRLARPYFKSTAGCDPSNEMLKSCTDLEVRHQVSPNMLPYAEGTFDFVTAVCVYHHVPLEGRISLTTEALRVLRPGGTFCIIEHNPLNPVTRFIVARSPVDADARLMTAREASRLLANAGARILGKQFFLLFPERLHRRTRRLEDALAAFPFGGQYAIFTRRRV